MMMTENFLLRKRRLKYIYMKIFIYIDVCVYMIKNTSIHLEICT